MVDMATGLRAIRVLPNRPVKGSLLVIGSPRAIILPVGIATVFSIAAIETQVAGGGRDGACSV